MRVFRNLFQADVYFIWLDLSWPSAQMIPDVFCLRTVLWQVKPGQYGRCLCVSTSASASLASFGASWLQRRLPVSSKATCSVATVSHILRKRSGYGLKGPVLVPGPDKQHQRCPATACWCVLAVLLPHKPLSHPFLLLEQGFLNNEQQIKPKAFPSFQPHCNRF